MRPGPEPATRVFLLLMRQPALAPLPCLGLPCACLLPAWACPLAAVAPVPFVASPSRPLVSPPWLLSIPPSAALAPIASPHPVTRLRVLTVDETQAVVRMAEIGKS